MGKKLTILISVLGIMTLFQNCSQNEFGEASAGSLDHKSKYDERQDLDVDSRLAGSWRASQLYNTSGCPDNTDSSLACTAVVSTINVNGELVLDIDSSNRFNLRSSCSYHGGVVSVSQEKEGYAVRFQVQKLSSPPIGCVEDHSVTLARNRILAGKYWLPKGIASFSGPALWNGASGYVIFKSAKTQPVFDGYTVTQIELPSPCTAILACPTADILRLYDVKLKIGSDNSVELTSRCRVLKGKIQYSAALTYQPGVQIKITVASDQKTCDLRATKEEDMAFEIFKKSVVFEQQGPHAASLRDSTGRLLRLSRPGCQ